MFRFVKVRLRMMPVNYRGNIDPKLKKIRPDF